MSEINQRFETLFGLPPEATYFSPGRVNLIGEHIDYNGGCVMPVAVDRGNYFAVAANDTGQLRVHSSLFEATVTLEPGELPTLKARGHWSDYLVGMAQRLPLANPGQAGIDVLVVSDLAQNSGLSSSASFCVGFGFALAEQSNLDIDRVALALMAQSVENNFVGVNCGIMDQFAVAMGKQDHCILLNCDTMEWELQRMQLAGYQFVIVNSMVPRKLSGSNYNLRRSECQQALEILQKDYPVDQLCELSVEQVESCNGLHDFDVLRRRARHASSENARVLDSATALREGNLDEFGSMMNASHDSLRDDYEVSCPELDFLVDTARSFHGVLGSRMTGAGFGGCTVSLVESKSVPEFSAGLAQAYSLSMGREPEIIPVMPGDGVRRVE